MWAAHNIPFSVMWGFFLKIVDWKKKNKKLSAAAFLLNFLCKKKYWGSLKVLRGAGDLLIFEWEMVIYTQKKALSRALSVHGDFLLVFCAELRFWGQAESPRLFPIAVGAAGLVNLYLAVNVVIIPSPIGGTGCRNPRGRIKISVQIHTWRCLCSFSQEFSGWALLFWEGEKNKIGSFLFSLARAQLVLTCSCPGMGMGCEQRSAPRRALGLGRANSKLWAGGGAWKWEQSSGMGWVMH